MNTCQRCNHLQGRRCFVSGWIVTKEWFEQCKKRHYRNVNRSVVPSNASNNPVMRLMRNVIKF